MTEAQERNRCIALDDREPRQGRPHRRARARRRPADQSARGKRPPVGPAPPLRATEKAPDAPDP
jgi:hypothetical protein